MAKPQDKVIISCAVTGAMHTPTMSPYLPITPDQIAEQSIEAAEAGAAILHLHARNPVDGSPYSATDAANVHRFQQKLESLGVNATVRRRLGSEISAACGQLRRDEMNGKA